MSHPPTIVRPAPSPRRSLTGVRLATGRRELMKPNSPHFGLHMLDGFTRTEIKTSGARIVTCVGGNGPPLLLMHGNPFNHLSWHKVAPTLASEFTVVPPICAATAIARSRRAAPTIPAIRSAPWRRIRSR